MKCTSFRVITLTYPIISFKGKSIKYFFTFHSMWDNFYKVNVSGHHTHVEIQASNMQLKTYWSIIGLPVF